MSFSGPGFDTEILKEYLTQIAGQRHGWENYEELERRASFIEERFSSFGLAVESQSFFFHGRRYRNIVATLAGTRGGEAGLLLGAHYDAARGSPGADDNGSGVAALLCAAEALSGGRFRRTIQFVGFTLEEPQPQTIHFLLGSTHFVSEAKRMRRRYDAVLILESVGYADSSENSQIVPPFVGISVPRRGDFLGVIANRRSNDILQRFTAVSGLHVPGLKVVPYKIPCSGRFVPESRFSDHAPFWDRGYPAIMLTDTAMFRNPHYHTPLDRIETINFSFLTDVTKAVLWALRELGEET